ncbi:MAG TPA: prepilin-type N-terminal cleavage/methylation domain-containing protein [Phycisphaerae bacterium]|nr:prepilin-type N-terminal cleavage/methylation domain-containing protein [Phycisphaerae bacterium]
MPAAEGFTLIELLVVVAILAVLMAIMAASLARVRMAGKSFVCKNQLKNIAFDFIQFADDYAHPWRGDSDQDGKSGFHIEDFQERQYVIGEFWKVQTQEQASQTEGVKLKASAVPLICPAGPQELRKKPFVSCSQQAIGPLNNVSMGLNMRLDRVSVQTGPGQPGGLVKVRLSKRILARTTVPLVLDVDGQAALTRNIDNLPYYSAPPTNSYDDYANGRYWFPSLRHGGRCNAAFIGGHVLSSARPEREAGWDWKYQPPRQ